jgi:type VI secretion system protein ImpA
MPDLHSLLQPLPNTPTGADLSFSPEFDAIAEMRRADDPTLSQGEWVTELKTANWSGVAKACEALLADKTKDLRVASWLLEAWAQLRGYEGLADGLTLAQGLCEQHWPTLHPQPDEGDFELRTGALTRLLGQVTQLANSLPVLKRGTQPFSLLDMEVARNVGAALAKARDPSDVATAGKPTPDDISKAQRETSPTLIAQRLAQGQRAQAQLQALQAVVDAHLGLDGPAFTPAKQALENAVHALERLARDTGAVAGAAPASAATEASASAAGASAQAGNAGQAVPAFGVAPTSRAQALAQLRLVAEYFRTHEPHSPVAYLAERAAHWGELPLHEWLRLVMKEGGTLAQLEELLGVEPQREGRDSGY